MKIDTTKGCTGVIIDEGCSVESFHKIAALLKTNLHILFTTKVSDLDSIYWDFIYKEAELTFTL